MEYKNLPDLDGWATLKAIVEKGGVTEAANTLNVSQSAVSKRLKNLEMCYGLPLMQRIGGRLRLTPAGEKVYLMASNTLEKHFLIKDEINDLKKGKTSLRMAVTFTIGEHLLPDLLLKFKEQYKDYQIISRLAYSRQIQKDLATSRVDLAITEIAPDHPDILVQKWCDDELWLICGAKHPLSGTALLPVEELVNLKYVLREQRSSIRDSLDPALRSIGIDQLNIDLEVGSSQVIIDILKKGQHVSFMPRFAVYDLVSKGELFHIKVNGFRILRTLWMARNRDALDHPVGEAFIKLIREVPVTP